MAEEKTLHRVSASCDLPSRVPLFLDVLSAEGTATLPGRLVAGGTEAHQLSPSHLSFLCHYLQENDRAKVHTNSASLSWEAGFA